MTWQILGNVVLCMQPACKRPAHLVACSNMWDDILPISFGCNILCPVCPAEMGVS